MKIFARVHSLKFRGSVRRGTATVGVLLCAFLFLGQRARADIAVWLADPADNNWNNPANWSTGTVPGGQDEAVLKDSMIRDLAITESNGTTDMIFDTGADAFTITAQPGVSFEFIGHLFNFSDVKQNFIARSDGDSSGFFVFNGDSGSDSTIIGPVTFTQNARNNAGSATPPLVQFTLLGAGNATIHNLGASVAGGVGGLALFHFTGTSAENSTIINEGATASGATGGSAIFYQSKPTAGNATLVAKAGSYGGGGGFFSFEDASLGGTARAQLYGNGYLGLSGRTGPSFTIGSIEGDGQVYLGRQNFVVGSNNLSTTFAGVLHPGAPGGGGDGNGALTKIGTGTLTLTGANLYTNGTTLTEGALVVSNTAGSGTGTGAVQVNGGTLGGKGTISGAVTINGGAFLAPAHGTKNQSTLTIQSPLTFNANATYTYSLMAKPRKAKSDLVIANGVTINSGAIFTFKATLRGKLRRGTVFILISNTSSAPFNGAFSNLADDEILTVNGNNFQADYQGGDGNDLTLTIVP